MTIRIVFALALMSFCAPAFSQHADVEFGYDSTSSPTTFIVEESVVTCEQLLLFESEMVALDPFNQDDLGADDPGFATNSLEGLDVNPGDLIWLNVLDASEYSQFGLGYVTFYNPATDSLEALGRIAIEDNSVGTPDLVLSGTSGIESGSNPQFIDVGNSTGTIHDHVIFDLLDDATTPVGALGIMVQLQADLAPTDGEIDVESEPFWIVFNHGMSTSDFENLALRKFGVTGSVPVDLNPDAFAITRGTYASGGASDLAGSDNSDVSARRRTNDISSRVFLEVETTTTATSPIQLSFTVEASVFARSTVTQSIDLYNHVDGIWEEIDSRNAARFADAVAAGSAGGDLSRFIESGTGLLKARVRFESVNPRQQFTANIDQTIWTIKE